MIHSMSAHLRIIGAAIFLIAFGLITHGSAEPISGDNSLEIIHLNQTNQLLILRTIPSSGHQASIAISAHSRHMEIGEFKADLEGSLTSDLGIITQSGYRQSAALQITGAKNFFSITQSGDANEVKGVISGTENQAKISQAGSYQRAVFSQTGQNNHVAIDQRM